MEEGLRERDRQMNKVQLSDVIATMEARRY